MQRWAGSCLLLSTLVLFTNQGRADTPPFDPAIDVQLFEYAIGPRSFLTVSDGDTASKNQYSVDFLLTFLTNPFTVYNVSEDGDALETERTMVVRRMFAGDLSAAYGLSDRMQLGVALPLILDMRGDGLNPEDAMPSPEGLRVTGLGDLRAELKLRLWKQGGMRLAASGGVTVPTSVGTSSGDFLGDDLPSLRGRVSWQWISASGKLTAGTNLGVIVRKPRELYASTIGQQLVYGGAAAYKVNERISAVTEIFGRADLGGMDLASSPLELDGGLRVRVTPSVSFLISGGAGLVHGVGAPDVRASLSVGWAPDYRDADGDRIANLQDRCPLLAEDADEFEDEDGCPDEDNDSDRREDAVDQCRNDKEDIDGFEDDDGCPELDNDKDSIPDLEDRCPAEAEDKVGLLPKDGCPASQSDGDADSVMDNEDKCPEKAEDADGFQDADGCPEADNDQDGTPDDQDRCALCREDADGFEDQDGCPDLDNDRDGLADREDRCPNETEVVNGTDDFDGCPDRGGATLAQLEGNNLVMAERLEFRRNNRLSSSSERVVDQAAAVIRSHPEITRWLVVVAAPRERSDEETREKSQRQANVIKAQLLMRGVDSARVEAVGAVSDDPRIAIVVRERAEATDQALVCPAELSVQSAAPAELPAAGE